MKIQDIQKILQDDLARSGDVPKWMDQFLYVLNNFIDQVGQALQGRLDFANNFYGVEVSFSMTHGVAQSYSPPPGRRVKGVLVIDASGQIVSGYGFTKNSNGSVSITVNFAAGAGTKAACLIQVQLM